MALACELKPGMNAPLMTVGEWVKGEAFRGYDEHEFTVVQFWATWCAPCAETFPHLRPLAQKYRDQVGFYAISVQERGLDIRRQVHHFVAQASKDMTFSVGRDTADGAMNRTWLQACSSEGLPNAFVVDKTGTIVWIGHPLELERVLPNMLNGQFDRMGFVQAYEKTVTTAERHEAPKDQCFAAKKLYEAGKKQEALALLDSVPTLNDPTLINLKKATRLVMFSGEKDRAAAYIDHLVKEGGSGNAQVLVRFVYVVRPDSSKELKSLAGKAIAGGVQIDAKNPLLQLQAAQAWIILGAKDKARAALGTAEKLLAERSGKVDQGIQLAIKDIREKINAPRKD